MRTTIGILIIVFGGLILSTQARAQGENGRRYDFTTSMGQFAKEAMLADARQTVWNSWSLKKNAKVTLRHHGIDGYAKVTTFSVNCGRKGDCLVELVVSQRHGLFGLQNAISDRSIYRIVDRVEVTTYAGSPEIPMRLPAETVRDPSLYRTRLKGKVGTEDFIF